MTHIQDIKMSRLEPLYFFLACFAIALLILGLRFLDITFEEAFRQKYASWVDWLWAVISTAFYGALLVGGLILLFPYAALEKSKLVKRGKKLFGIA